MRTAVALYLICLAAGFLPARPPEEGVPKSVYCGSAKSDKYHRPGCKWVKKIRSENLVWFASRKEASQKGYRPCAVCKP